MNRVEKPGVHTVRHATAKRRRCLLSVAAIFILVFAGFQNVLAQSANAGGNGNAVVSGVVTEARFGQALSGALIRVQGTEQSTFADDKGKYELTRLPAGNYTIEVEFFGFETQQATVSVDAGGSAVQDFSLSSPTAVLDEITVYGQTSAISAALAEQRAADNVSTVISDSFLGNKTGSTVVEVLKSAPAITFSRDRRTGDGSEISVRGLGPDFNTVKVNGLQLSGTGTSRSPQLDGILADSISKVTIHKTLLPSHDSNGTGGLIEIETKSPLERQDGFMSFGIEGNRFGGDFGDGYKAGAAVSRIFGENRNFGLGASLEYQDRSTLTYEIEPRRQAPRYLPTFADGTLIDDEDQIDPIRQFPFEDFDGASDLIPESVIYFDEQIDIENLVATLTAEWNVSDRTNLRFDYVHTEKETVSFSNELTAELRGRYRSRPVAALNGEERYTYVTDEFESNLNATLYDEDETVDTFGIRGETGIGAWDLEFALGHTKSRTDAPRTEFEGRSPRDGLVDVTTAFLPGALNANGEVDRGFTSGPAPALLLTPEGTDAFFDPSLYEIDEFFDILVDNDSNRTTGDLSARREFNGDRVRYVEFGGRYQDYDFRSFFRGGSDTDAYEGARGVRLTDVAVPIDRSNFGAIGFGSLDVPAFTPATVRDFSTRVDDLLDQGLLELGSEFLGFGNSTTAEEDLSLYFQSELNFGKLQIIGGARYNAVDVDATVRQIPNNYRDENGDRLNFRPGVLPEPGIVNINSDTSNVLPRFLANYRFSENLILRGGYYASLTRPQLRDLADAVRIDVDLRPNRREIRARKSNPALKPSKTNNFDITLERYTENLGIFKVGLFYKRVKDHIQNSTSTRTESREQVVPLLPDHPLYNVLTDPINSDLRFELQTVENGDSGTIKGIELEYLTRFDRLPGVFGGLGLLANITLSDSELDRELVYETQDGEDAVRRITNPFSGDPEQSGALGLTYNRGRIDSSLIFTQQDRHIRFARAHGLHDTNEAIDSLDFKLSYLGFWGDAEYTIFFEANDLLKGSDDPGTERLTGGIGSVPAALARSRYYGGRNFVLGMKAVF